MDILWLLIAFICGLGVKFLALPPLVGFLAAGFWLNAIGVGPQETLDALADLGITLMLFTIGLKLNVNDLLKLEVWGGTLSHMLLWSLGFGLALLGLAAFALPYFADVAISTAALLAFAFSFSSTVCVIKILEERGELNARHGKFSIAVLVMQDIAAVVFLVLATGKMPSPWAVLLAGLYFARPLLDRLLTTVGHGELLTLTGFLLALGGYQLFDLVGIKGDLGALVFGMLLSKHDKAGELAYALLGFKDLFLIAFFLTIGLTALPDFGMIAVALALCLLLPLKLALFFTLFTRLRLRARHAFLSSIALANYSEFGLIVAYLSVQSGWMDGDWLVILALAVSLSFVMTSIAYRFSHAGYARWKESLRRFESSERLPADVFDRPSSAEILVVGMGRVGRGAFESLHKTFGDRVWGMDSDRERIARQRAEGMHVFDGDGENADVWDAVDVTTIKLVLITVPKFDDCRGIAKQLRMAGYAGPVAAMARFSDDREALLAARIDEVFNFSKEAGVGFAERSLRLIGEAR